MATDRVLVDLLDGGSNNVRKEETLDIIDCFDDHSSNTKQDLLPTLTDDLMNLCDNYNLYLVNEEIVYTEPLDLDTSVVVGGSLLGDDLFGSEDIGNDKDVLNGNDYQSVIDSLNNTNIGPFRCTVCRQSFDKKREQEEHVKLHEIWPLDSCQVPAKGRKKQIKREPKERTTIDSLSLNDDTVKNTSDGKPYVCRYCFALFSRLSLLVSHERIHGVGNNVTVCNKCSVSFPNGVEFDAHQQECKSTKTLPLPNVSQPKKPRKKRQTATVTSKTSPSVAVKKPISYKVPCPECNKMFQTRQKMQRHKWIHRKKAFSCEVCAMSFQIKSELDSHRLSEHAESKKYMCTDCGKSFASRQGLWEHSRLHDENKPVPYRCTKCAKTLSSRSGMLIHLRTHSDEKPYTCSFCHKPFRDGGTLRKHLRIHTGVRPHVCPLCDRTFNQKVVMREHIRWVHAGNAVEYKDPAPYNCWLCEKHPPLMDREELCMHIVKHSDQIASVVKRMEKQNKTINLDAEAETVPLLNDPVADVPTEGVKCELSVIRKNRQMLGYIDRLNDRHSADVKAISTELQNSVCLSNEVAAKPQ